MSELVERVDDQDRVLGVVERAEAIRRGWPHRIATVVCRDAGGRILVHQRPTTMSRFPGQYNVMFGGAVGVGESYEAAATRELAEETGIHAQVRFLFKFLCRGAISPYWLAVHEAVITDEIVPDPKEVAWHGWMSEAEVRHAIGQLPFVPDGQEAFARYIRSA